jgi:vacuolar-type H+-ATPase subunit I/STV1
VVLSDSTPGNFLQRVLDQVRVLLGELKRTKRTEAAIIAAKITPTATIHSIVGEIPVEADALVEVNSVEVVVDWLVGEVTGGKVRVVEDEEEECIADVVEEEVMDDAELEVMLEYVEDIEAVEELLVEEEEELLVEEEEELVVLVVVVVVVG